MGSANNIIGNVKSKDCGVRLKLDSREQRTRKKPKTNEPVSPKKIVAGNELYLKNPINPPIKEAHTAINKTFDVITAIAKIIENISREIPLTKPSKPSNKFIAFNVPTINRCSKT